VSDTDYTASNDWINELSRVQKRLWRNLKYVLSRNLPEGTEKEHETPDPKYCPSRDSYLHSPNAPQKHCCSVRTSNVKTFLIFWGGGVKLSPLGTSATNWHVVPAPDDR
jgi:hypothetical protein